MHLKVVYSFIHIIRCRIGGEDEEFNSSQKTARNIPDLECEEYHSLQKLKTEIRQLLFSLYCSKHLTKITHNNIMKIARLINLIDLDCQ